MRTLIAAAATAALFAAGAAWSQPTAAPALKRLPAGRPGPVQAIGPKQDDPLRPEGIIVQGGRTACPQGPVLAIGPKQDDPLVAPGDGGGGRGGPVLALGPKQDDPLVAPGDGGGGGGPVLAIGPKQDDPVRPGGALARPGDDEDPHAAGGRTGTLAIGPKQDDPVRPGGALARPGDDEDPHARCAPARPGG